MTEGVLVAIIGGTQAVVVALISALMVRFNKVRRDTQATRENVVNDHTINLRDENDQRHVEVTRALRDIGRDIGGVRQELRGLRETDRALDRRVTTLEELEMTDPGRKRT